MPDVRFRDCACPGTPHDGLDGHDDGDIAVLRPFLDYAGGAEASAAFNRAVRTAELDDEGNVKDLPQFAELVGPVYLRRGIVSWNVLDEHGPVPVAEAEPGPALNEVGDDRDTLQQGPFDGIEGPCH